MTSSERRRAQTPTISRPGQVSDAELNDLRRRIYLAVGTVGVFTTTGIWLLNLSRDTPDPVTTFTNPLFVLLNLWVIWWMAGRRPVDVVHWVSLLLCGGVVVVRAVTTPLLGGANVLNALQDLYWLLVVMSIISFLTLGYRRASWVTATFYVAGTAVPWVTLLLSGTELSAPTRLGQVQLLCGIVLLTLCSLAWYRDHFQRGRVELQITRRLASTDALTGLSNRHALYPMLDGLLALPAAEDGVCGTLLLIDVDHFKRVNDRLGHAAGDDVLRQLAACLRAHLREGDLLGRWGGEEFLVGLPAVRGGEALLVAERLRRMVAEAHLGPGDGVTVSVGVSSALAGDTLEACVSRADAALYQAKRQGRNRVKIYEAPFVPPAPHPADAPAVTPGA